MEQISIFDIFKVCIGPSSSHTMGPWLAANDFARKISDEEVESVHLKLYGSLAKTGKGHGTHIAAMLGLSGYDVKTFAVDAIADTIAKINSEKILQLNNNRLNFDPEINIEYLNKTLPAHSNALSFTALLKSGQSIHEVYYSIGGGFILREGASKSSDNNKKIIPFPVQDEKDLLDWVDSTGLSIDEIVLKNEQTLRSSREIQREIDDIWNVMLECMYKGCHAGGILPGGLNVKRRAAPMHHKLLGEVKVNNSSEWLEKLQIQQPDFETIIQWVSCFALAVNEENASFGRVITAPTNGAAGVIPAVLMYLICFCKNKSEKSLKKFLLVAGEMGSLFKKGATLSAAMGGCQAEIGVSSAMAAGGLTACLNGTSKQILMAAEIAMEHHLGLTCDPVGGLVQIPCIERNAMGAVKAITASQIALSSEPENARVSLDNVIKTMKETALDMQDKFKETSEGGLAVNVPVNLPEC